MNVIYQGVVTETGAADLAGFLRELGLPVAELVIEFNGEILAGAVDLLPELRENDRIEVFRIVTGG